MCFIGHAGMNPCPDSARDLQHQPLLEYVLQEDNRLQHVTQTDRAQSVAPTNKTKLLGFHLNKIFE